MTDGVTPIENLATLAVDRLIASGLIRADKRDTIIGAIASGSMSSEDWRLEIELASAKVES